jgi:hypothetical protein
MPRLFSIGQVTVATTAIQIVPAAGSQPNSPGGGYIRQQLQLTNTGSVAVFVSNSPSVTTSTGFPIASGQTVNLCTDDALYGIAASGSNVVGFAEMY